MLSPRTVSLRVQSRTLLQSLHQCAEAANQHRASKEMGSPKKKEGGYFGIHATATNNPGFAPMIEQSGQNQRVTTTFQSCDCKATDFERPDNIQGENKTSVGNLHADKMHIQGVDNILWKSPMESTCSSFANSAPHAPENFKKDVYEAMAEMGISTSGRSESLGSFNKMGSMRRSFSESYIRGHNVKSIYLEQQQAADAQMHAPTHSHLISKCYCTQSHNIKPRPDSKFIVQLYGRKQHVPQRLKKQRYRARSLPRHSRIVKWADTHNKETPSSYEEKTKYIQTASEQPWKYQRHSPENHTTCSPNHAHTCRVPPTDLLEKVKSFRESHWSDCHALPRESPRSSQHECVQHYFLNSRLFLEPVHREGRCPLCTSTPLSSVEQMLDTSETSTSPEKLSCQVLVTLPKIIQGHSKSRLRLSSDRNKSNKNNTDSQKSCFLVSHHRLSAKAKSSFYISDSLALKYQKKAY